MDFWVTYCTLDQDGERSYLEFLMVKFNQQYLLQQTTFYNSVIVLHSWQTAGSQGKIYLRLPQKKFKRMLLLFISTPQSPPPKKTFSIYCYFPLLVFAESPRSFYLIPVCVFLYLSFIIVISTVVHLSIHSCCLLSQMLRTCSLWAWVCAIQIKHLLF